MQQRKTFGSGPVDVAADGEQTSIRPRERPDRHFTHFERPTSASLDRSCELGCGHVPPMPRLPASVLAICPAVSARGCALDPIYLPSPSMSSSLFPYLARDAFAHCPHVVGML